MHKELIKTFNALMTVNKDFGKSIKDFDIEDVLQTFDGSRKRLTQVLSKLEEFKFEDNNQLNELLIYLKLEYDNFLWCFDEMREIISKTLSNVPD